jgi:hypothetical protein
MALTINPAVSGGRANFILHSAAFAGGAFMGALISAFLLVLVYGVLVTFFPEDWVTAGALALITWAVLHDLGAPVQLPYRPGQVPEWFRRALPPGAVALAFGMQLGVGFLTFFTYSAQLAMLVALPFLGSLGDILLVIGVFSIGKTLVLLTTLGTTSVDQITPRFKWTVARARILRITTACTSVIVGVTLAGTSLSM